MFAPGKNIFNSSEASVVATSNTATKVGTFNVYANQYGTHLAVIYTNRLSAVTYSYVDISLATDYNFVCENYCTNKTGAIGPAPWI